MPPARPVRAVAPTVPIPIDVLEDRYPRIRQALESLGLDSSDAATLIDIWRDRSYRGQGVMMSEVNELAAAIDEIQLDPRTQDAARLFAKVQANRRRHGA